MRVVHLCTTAQGGAARAVLILNQGLLGEGIFSTVLTPANVEHQSPWHVNHHRKYVADLLVWNNRTDRSNTHFSLDCLGKDVSEHPAVREADVIHLHWVADFLTSESVHRLAMLGKPLVWTLHDMRPFTGGCHFSADCERFKTDCADCPQIQTHYLNITRTSLDAMGAALAGLRIAFVAPSLWISHQFKVSKLGRSHALRNIANAVDITMFTKQDRAESRKQLGLMHSVRYILLASHSFAERRKGLSLAIEVLAEYQRQEDARQPPHQCPRLLLCGEEAPELPGWVCDSVGFVSADKMPMVYSAADVMLFTPLEDNLPNVILEAMACELPVISHCVGGIPDMLENVQGLPDLPRSGDVTGIARALSECLHGPDHLLRQIGQSGRRIVDSRFTIKRQAKAHINLYGELLSGAASPGVGEFSWCSSACATRLAPMYPGLEENLEISWDPMATSSPLTDLLRYVETRAMFQQELEKISQGYWPWILHPYAWWARIGRARMRKKIRVAEQKILSAFGGAEGS